MRKPRVSIAVLMAAVAIVAADFAIVAKAYRTGNVNIPLIIILPSLPTWSVLVLSLILIASDLRRYGEAGPFALGFVAIGSGAVALTLIGFALDTRTFLKPFDWVFGWVAGGVANTSGGTYVLPVLVFTIWTPPQLLVACLGGLLARRVGLKLVIGSRRAVVGPSPEIPPAAVSEPAPAA